jgi:hypothetical protein
MQARVSVYARGKVYMSFDVPNLYDLGGEFVVDMPTPTVVSSVSVKSHGPNELAELARCQKKIDELEAEIEDLENWKARTQKKIGGLASSVEGDDE